MEKLKILINGNEYIANQAKSFFSKPGYYISKENRNNAYGWSLGDGVGDYYVNKIAFDYDSGKEVTIDQLRDLVVLKRNDPNDANVNQEGGIPCLYDLYLTNDKELYFYHCGKEKWILSNLNHDEDYYKLLKPIQADKVEVKVDNVSEKLSKVDETLKERQSQYGCFEDVAFVTQGFIEIMNKCRYKEIPQPHQMALYMIASKMARLVNGDCNHKDSWHDIGGYAKLIEDLIGDNS